MKEHIHQVMPSGLHAEELDIEQVRQRRQGMPIAGMDRRERPSDAIRGPSRLDVGVAGDVRRVIVDEKGMAAHL